MKQMVPQPYTLATALRFLCAAALLVATLAAAPLRAQNTPPTSPNGRFPHNLRPAGATQLPAEPPPPPTSTLPPTPPTSAPPPPAQTGPISATSNGTPSTRPRRASVRYIDGQIQVSANDSSLNQILREISRATGMTITGGVADQRVFGSYGPASPSTILATLLDGTGTNMLLREGSELTPPELVLTPRGGGATPPSPSALPDDSIADQPTPAPAAPVPASPVAAQPAPAQPQPTPAAPAQPVNAALPVGNPIPANNVNGSQYNTTPTASQIPTTNSVGLDTLSAPTTTPAASGIVDSPNPPGGAVQAPGTTTPAAPAGPLTPEQVFQKLLQMQQKQAQPQPASPTTTPPE
jgi:hypothetical protein